MGFGIVDSQPPQRHGNDAFRTHEWNNVTSAAPLRSTYARTGSVARQQQATGAVVIPAPDPEPTHHIPPSTMPAAPWSRPEEGIVTPRCDGNNVQLARRPTRDARLAWRGVVRGRSVRWVGSSAAEHGERLEGIVALRSTMQRGDQPRTTLGLSRGGQGRITCVNLSYRRSPGEYAPLWYIRTQMGSSEIATLLLRIATVATRAIGLGAWRSAVLDLVCDAVEVDAAGLHALSPRVPLESGAWRGLELESLRNSMEHWDQMAVELGTFREYAIAHAGVATDTEVFKPKSAARRRFRRVWADPFGFAHLAAVHLTVRERIHAVMLLMRRRRPFTAAEAELLRHLAPAVAVADALHERLDQAPGRSMPISLRCVDQRLTARQREIVEHVALGHTNEDIGRAMGLSANTVRNHLARIYPRLGASNRADLVRLAVLR
jgi:DNA-binding CsgD family transcriptional regulator